MKGCEYLFKQLLSYRHLLLPSLFRIPVWIITGLAELLLFCINIPATGTPPCVVDKLDVNVVWNPTNRNTSQSSVSSMAPVEKPIAPYHSHDYPTIDITTDSSNNSAAWLSSD
jgi:hypothetical protein